MTKNPPTPLLVVLVVFATSCSRYVTETGTASYYGSQFNNRETASGSKYNPKRRTAAHKTLPFGTKVIVTNEKAREVSSLARRTQIPHGEPVEP